MDPATIIGTTSAVLSFVQFSGRVLTTAWSLYESVAGTLEEHACLEDVTVEMRRLVEGLPKEEWLKIPPRHPQQEKDSLSGLQAVAQKCEELGGEILTLLEKLRIDQKKRKGSGKYLLAALKAGAVNVWKKETIKDLRDQLQMCSSNLNTHLVMVLG